MAFWRYCYWSDYKTVVSCLLENHAKGVKLVSKNDASKTQITEYDLES